jgi:hypothetical protein
VLLCYWYHTYVFHNVSVFRDTFLRNNIDVAERTIIKALSSQFAQIGKDDIPCDRLGSKVLHCIKQLLMTTNDKQLLQILYFTNICYKCFILRTFATNVCSKCSYNTTFVANARKI